jgi:hypothetical protein
MPNKKRRFQFDFRIILRVVFNLNSVVALPDRVDIWGVTRIRRLQTEIGRTREFTQVRPPGG